MLWKTGLQETERHYTGFLEPIFLMEKNQALIDPPIQRLATENYLPCLDGKVEQD